MHLAQLAHLGPVAIRDTNKPPQPPPTNPDLQLMKWRKDIILKLLLRLQLRPTFQPWRAF